MGREKALLRIGDRTLLELAAEPLRACCREVLISARDAEKFRAFGHRVILDLYDVPGPLTGIHSAVHHAAFEKVAVLGCDMPFVRVELLRLLYDLSGEVDVVMPRTESGPEPLCAIYSRACLVPIARSIESGRFRVVDFLDDVRCRFVSEGELRAADAELRSFVNVNTVEEYVRISTRVEGRSG